MKKNNMCQMIALMSGIGMFALPTLANASSPGGTGTTNFNTSAAKGNKTLKPTTTQNQQDVPSQQMGSYKVTDLDGNGFIDTADLSLLLLRLGTTGVDVVTTDSAPASATNATASVAGLQGLYAKNYMLAADGSAATDSNAHYSVMDVYIKFNTANGTGSNGERIVSVFGQNTTSANTYGVDQKAKYLNSAGLAFQHSNSGWMPGSTAGGGTGNNSWDSFVTLGCRNQGFTNTGGVLPDPYFANPAGPDVSSIVGAPNSSGAYPGAGWAQNNPLDALYETNASANADKLIMIGRFTLKCSDIVALGAGAAAPKMVMWLQTTGKSVAQTGGTSLFTISGANLRSDAQTKLTGNLVYSKVFTFDPTFDGVDVGQEAWTFSTSGYTISNPVLALTSNAVACNPIGAHVDVDATLSGVVSPIVAGQVYLTWNSSKMKLDYISEGEAPFSQFHVINQTAGTALILVSLEQGGSAISVSSKVVARMHFTVVGGSCDGSGTDIQFFPDGTLPTEFTDGVGGKMVPTLVASSGFKVDDGAPVLGPVPPDVVVNADASMSAGSGFATVALTQPTATDACAPGLTVSSSRNDGQPLSAAFLVGTTTVTWSATDPCANSTTATTRVTVNNANTGDFAVSYTNSASYAASSARLLTLNIHGTNGYTLKASQPATLVYGAATISLTDLAVDTYDCVAIEEKGRSLRRVATVIDGGLVWSSTATLVAGDLINDEVVDVLDWGAYIVGNPNADLDGNGAINANDGNIIITNFGQKGETGCGTSFMSPPEPLSGISVAELVDRGLTDLVSADLNNDGWLDMEDVRMAGNGGHMNKDSWVDVAVVRNAN